MVTLSYQENQSMEARCLVSAASEDFASQELSITPIYYTVYPGAYPK